MSSRPPTRYRLERGEISLVDRVAEVRSTAETIGPPPRPTATDGSWRGTTCKWCGAAIVWCTTVNDKRMPVDAGTHPQGNVRITAGPRADVYGPLEAMTLGEPLHLPHHATCPYVSQWSAKHGHKAPKPVAAPSSARTLAAVPPAGVVDELAAARARRAARRSGR